MQYLGKSYPSLRHKLSKGLIYSILNMLLFLNILSIYGCTYSEYTLIDLKMQSEEIYTPDQIELTLTLKNPIEKWVYQEGTQYGLSVYDAESRAFVLKTTFSVDENQKWTLPKLDPNTYLFQIFQLHTYSSKSFLNFE